MKKIIIALTALALLSTVVFAEPGTGLFNDVNDETTYKTGIEFLVSQGIVKGYKDNTYKPMLGLKRAEMIKIVVEGSLVYNGTDKNVLNAFVNASCFTDVPKFEWYAKYVCYAKEEGWVKGYAGNTYKPDQQVNNVEALKMVSKGFGMNYTESTEPWYKDVVEDFSDDNLIPYTFFGFDHGMDRGTMADMIARAIHHKEGTLNGYLGDRADIVVTYDSIKAGQKLFGLTKDEVTPGEGCNGSACAKAELTINAQNNSGQSGKATLTENGSKTTVVLELTGGPSDTKQPVHIHAGSCNNLGSVEYPLDSVEDGSSTTTIDVSLDDLLKDAKESPGLAINIHKSDDESEVYYACGNIITLEEEDVQCDYDDEKYDVGDSIEKDKNTTCTCGEGGELEECVVDADPVTHTVEITADGFSPKTLTINAGDTVKWINKGSDKRWPASADHPTHKVYPGSDNAKCGTDEADTIFDACSGLSQDQSWSFTFDEKGAWGYHDHLKSTDKGTITVE